jgi:putative membrane protein
MSDTPASGAAAGPTNRLALDRTRLAHERTMLAWTRTATSLISFGFSIQQFFRVARAGAPESRWIGPQQFGTLMIVIGLVALLLATLEHRSAIASLKTEYPASEGYAVGARSRAGILAALIAILGLLALASMFFRS